MQTLAEGVLLSVLEGDVPMLLVRLNGILHVIGRICTHGYGDLEAGDLDNGCVVCPCTVSITEARASGLSTPSCSHGAALGRKTIPCRAKRGSISSIVDELGSAAWGKSSVTIVNLKFDFRACGQAIFQHLADADVVARLGPGVDVGPLRENDNGLPVAADEYFARQKSVLSR